MAEIQSRQMTIDSDVRFKQQHRRQGLTKQIAAETLVIAIKVGKFRPTTRTTCCESH